MGRWLVFAVVAALASASACWSFDLQPGRKADAGDEGEDAGQADEDSGPPQDADVRPHCEKYRGAPMIEVDGGTSRFCIDSREVTQTEYAAFAAEKKGRTGGQRADCTDNLFFEEFEDYCQYDPSTRGAYPVVCVDFCDAVAYCTWIGKRLCGAADGGAVPFDAGRATNASRWFAACSNGNDGQHEYAYGNAAKAGTCTVGNRDAGTTKAGSMSGCVGPSPGLFDMIGNVFEWEDSCSGTDCSVRGGAYYTDLAAAKCSTILTYGRTGKNNGVGFRCCAP